LAAWTQLAIPTPTIVAGRVNGEILRVDRFGNLVSNLDRRMVEHFAQGRGIEVAVGGRVVGSLVTTYADAAPGSVCALCGSSEHLEVAVSGGSAAELLGVARGATVTLSRV
jgi:S-adenosylmethionine hydrolase